MVETSDGLVAGWVGTWADGAAHLSFMSAFAFRDTFPLTHPLFIGNRFTYPFLADLIGGLLVRFGTSIPFMYVLLGLLLSLVLVGGLYFWFRLVFRHHLVALVASNLFLFTGGLGGVAFFDHLREYGILKLSTSLPIEYTHISEQNIEWINVVSSEILPQRAFLLGLPVGLVILSILWTFLNGKAKSWQLGLAGVLIGLLPLVHAHTLIVITGLTGWMFWLHLSKLKTRWRDWALLLLPALALGLPLTWWQTADLDGSFVRWLPGWLAGQKGDNWLGFWLKNWGVFPFLVFGGWLRLKRVVKLFFLPFFGLFLLANLMVFQPYAWDNTKVFTWVYLTFSGVAAVFLVQLWQKKRLIFRGFAVFLFFMATFSGLLDVVRLLQFQQTSHLMFTTEELHLAETVRSESALDSVFLTAPIHNHFVPTLTGRQIVMGYPGWLWTYGIDYRQREQDVKTMYQGGAAARWLLEQYGVDYVVVGPAERRELAVNEAWYQVVFPVTITSGDYRVYRVR